MQNRLKMKAMPRANKRNLDLPFAKYGRLLKRKDLQAAQRGRLRSLSKPETLGRRKRSPPCWEDYFRFGSRRRSR